MKKLPGGTPVIWTPQPGPQTAFVTCPFEEALYGGAAGGGKSDALLGDFAAGIEQYGSAWRGILFRRSYKQLEELEARAIEIFSPFYGIDSYKRGRHTWEFKTKKGTATLQLRAMEEKADAYKYQGHQYTWIGFDELTQWPSDFWLEYLFTRLRSPHGVPCYMRAATNPGGVGHSWVKARYRIGEVQPMTPIKVKLPSGAVRTRIFIPAKLDDNKILMRNDPTYLDRLSSISDPLLRRALRDGDWDIFAGAAFPEFRRNLHVIPNANVPQGVLLRRSCDWGYIKPYGVLWGYVDYDGRLVIVNEIYGMGDKPDTGNKEDPENVARRIANIEQGNNWQVFDARLDPQCWAEHDGGPSIFDRLGGYKLRWQPWPKGPNSRVAQKQMIHSLLKVDGGKPKLLIMERCQHLIRTLASLPVSPTNPEDVDTNSEDHLYDALRGLVSTIGSGVQPAPEDDDDGDAFTWETAGANPGFGGW